QRPFLREARKNWKLDRIPRLPTDPGGSFTILDCRRKWNPPAEMPPGNGETPRRNLKLDRLKVWLIGWIGYWVISIVGRTVRWESEGDSHLDEIYKSGSRAI